MDEMSLYPLHISAHMPSQHLKSKRTEDSTALPLPLSALSPFYSLSKCLFPLCLYSLPAQARTEENHSFLPNCSGRMVLESAFLQSSLLPSPVVSVQCSLSCILHEQSIWAPCRLGSPLTTPQEASSVQRQDLYLERITQDLRFCLFQDYFSPISSLGIGERKSILD